MPFALLLAMQAAGMVVDYIGTRNQAEMSKMGSRIQQAGLEANLYQTRAESENASLESMKELRKNLGSQIAVQSARGTSMSAGSSLALFNESIGNFNTDERMRRINQLGRENEIRAGKTISGLNQSSENSKLWSSFSSHSLNRFPSTLQGWQSGVNQFKSSFGLTTIK
jgi:hypothetical protein